MKVAGAEKARRRWWEVFCPSTEEKQLQELAKDIMSVYGASGTGVSVEDRTAS